MHVYDGIRHHAPKSGVTNEWLMFLQTKCYHPSESSIWKPEAYADYFTWNNRCHFYTGDPPKTGSTIAHFTYNVGTTLTGEDYRPAITPPRVQASFIAPEAPSGYNYVNNANSTYTQEEFYQSCRIYEPDAEIESCTIEFVQGEEIVVVTFKGRLHSHPAAPATVARDPLTWSETERDDLWAESFRTPDNALREYALHQVRGDFQCSRKIGDAGMVSSVFFLPDNPFGSCYPHFFFTRLVPEPYEDNNEQAEATDTRATVDAFIQMETYLRAMCEGFVDGQTSVANICAGHEASLYDYTYENLCFEAFGGRWINSFAQAARPDNPSGFGPLPNTLMYAEVFNRLARSVNLLTRARVSIPWKIETTIRDYHGGPRPVTTTYPSDGSACDTGNSRATCRGQAPPADQFVSSTHFPEGSAIGAFTACGFAGSCGPELEFQLFTLRQTCEYKMVANPTLTGYIEAIPPALRGLIDAAQTGFIGVQSHTTTRTRIKGQYPADSESPEYTHCNDPFPTIALFDNGNCSDPESPACLYYGHESTSQVTSFCSLFHSGVLDAGAAPPDSEYWVYYHVDQQCGGGAEYSISIAPVDLNTTGFVVVPLEEGI